MAFIIKFETKLKPHNDRVKRRAAHYMTVIKSTAYR